MSEHQQRTDHRRKENRFELEAPWSWAPPLWTAAGAVVAFGVGAAVGWRTDWAQRGIAALAGFLLGAIWAMMLFVSMVKRSHTKGEIIAAGLLAGVLAPAIAGIVFGAATGRVGEDFEGTITVGHLIKSALYNGGSALGYLVVPSGAAGWLFGNLCSGLATRPLTPVDARAARRLIEAEHIAADAGGAVETGDEGK
jgi:chromate transport protein ChrA